MATSNLEVFIAAFASEDEAGATLKDFQTMQASPRRHARVDGATP